MIGLIFRSDGFGSWSDFILGCSRGFSLISTRPQTEIIPRWPHACPSVVWLRTQMSGTQIDPRQSSCAWSRNLINWWATIHLNEICTRACPCQTWNEKEGEKRNFYVFVINNLREFQDTLSAPVRKGRSLCVGELSQIQHTHAHLLIIKRWRKGHFNVF